MRIAMIAPFGIRPKGTLSARMLPLAQALVQRGHTVQIIAPPIQNPQDAGTYVEHAGVVVLHTRLPHLPEPAGFVEQVQLLRQGTLAFQPDLVHLFKPKGFGGLAVLGLPNKIALVVDSDDWEGWGGWNDLLPYPTWAKRLFAWQEYDLPRRASAVTVVSRTIEHQILGFGVAAERVFYLPNGVGDIEIQNLPHPSAALLPSPSERGAGGEGTKEPKTPEPDDNVRAVREPPQPTILLYTRFWEFELPFLINVLQRIAAYQPRVRLLVVGKGEHGEEHELLRLAEMAGLRQIIDYRGWVEPDSIAGLLAQADLAIVPIANTLLNRARGLAKLLELLAAGLPIVASRVGQVAEYLVDRQSGLLAAPHDPNSMADLVIELLANPALQAQLAAGALARAELFRWERLALVAEQAYQQATKVG